MNCKKIRNLTLQAIATLPTLQLAPTERNCVQLANVYCMLREIDRLAQEKEAPVEMTRDATESLAREEVAADG